MKIKRDQIVGLALVVLGIVFAVLTMGFKKPMTAEYPGPKLMPMIAVFGLVVCGLGVFVNGCKQKEADKVILSVKGLVRVVISFVILCAYIFLMKYFGFLAVTPFILFAITEYFARSSGYKPKLWVVIVFSIAVTAIIYLMYVPLFDMTLPTGLLFE